MNTQQSSPSPQPFDASSWVNPAYASQYYGYTQPAPQDPYSNNTSLMASRQNMQSFPPVSFGGSFGNPSYQSHFDPRAQMLQNWTMAQSAYGSGVQFASQQYSAQPMPHQQTAYQQTPAQQVPMQSQTDIKQDPEAVDMYSGGYDDSRGPYSGDYNSPRDAYSGDYAAEDDPSAQLMQELVQNILHSKNVSPASDASDSKHEDVDQHWGDSTVNATESPLTNSVLYTPQDAQGAEHQTFKRFEDENPTSESEQSQQDELDQQVNQVLAGLDDEDIYLAESEREDSAPIDTAETADHVEVSSGTEDNDDEDDVMQVEEHAVEGEYEITVHDSEEEEANEDTMEEDVAEEEEDVDISDKDTMEDDAAEEDDVDIDVSDVETPSDQDAHDSGVDASCEVEFEGYVLNESPLKTIKKTISREDKELHHKAWKLQPHHLPAHRYWMAILMHTVQPSKAKVEKDFIWLKGSRVSGAN